MVLAYRRMRRTLQERPFRKTLHSAFFQYAARAAPSEALVASTKAPSNDRTGTAPDPAREPAGNDAGEAPETVHRNNEERELAERVRRKIKSISSKTKRYLN